MPKKPKRKNLRPPQKCIFCGAGGQHGNPISGEHIWPEWMHPDLPRMENPKNRTSLVSSNSQYQTTTTRLKSRIGHAYTKQLRVVCKNCNETWMGTIETAAQPALRPLVKGQRTLLDADAQLRLATWLALKALVLEHERRASPVASPEARTEFRTARRIPAGMQIWISRHEIFEWAAGYWVRGLALSSTPQPLTEPRKNVQTTALGAGHLFSLTAFSTFELVSGLEVENPFVTQLWPIKFDQIDWPAATLTRAMVGTLANVMDVLEASPFIRWGR